ncbi:3'-5' exoribonuclease YhaM family protein [Sporosalibacterium faouarense]|uniref:3'-5' exoribonuclease YhaM family protein n=1 Tax=Sporosalibacterium faouarense TaxID=516123 RepID=UPI00141C5493|nr:HD domain-containing protein [Sporosalibacterium faouarense]MTI48403.1 HD domain-containing protein [Bacillota bacterium]
MEVKKINEFVVGDYIEGFFLIKSVNIKTTNNNKKYLDITLSDKTGEINAKMWDCTEEDESKYKDNCMIKIRGNVTEWQGNNQFKIDRIRLANDEDDINIEEYVQAAPEDPKFMYGEILKYIDKIKNPDINKITSHVFKENKDKLLYYPAAKSNHHAIRSGLLYHIKRMLMTAEKLSEVYLNINKDFLFAGVILHDVAKIYEMDSNELGIVSDYTNEGQLLGHIIQGIKIIDKEGEKLGIDREVSMLLQHMILSHHNEPEFGSPKRPMIPEAELLHYIDMIDARMYDMEKALEGIEPKQFSDRVWVLNNRRLYKPAVNEE